MKKHTTISFLLLVSCFLNGQYIDGYLVDKYSRDPIVGALVELELRGEMLDTTFTDEDGYYVFKVETLLENKLYLSKKGYFVLDAASSLKYKVHVNKEEYVSMYFGVYSNDKKPKTYYLVKEIECGINNMFQDSIFRRNFVDGHINMKEIEQSLTTYDDKVRYFANVPGVSQLNDQSNALDYQGIPSAFQKYFLNGIEIYNPNFNAIIGNITVLNNREGGTTLGLPMISGLSFGHNRNNNNVSGIGGVLSIEAGDVSSYGKVSNLGMEFGVNKRRTKFGVKVDSPTILSGLGNYNGFQTGGNFSTLLTTHIDKGCSSIDWNFYCSFGGLDSKKIPFDFQRNEIESKDYSSFTRNLHFSRVWQSKKMKVDFSLNALSNTNLINSYENQQNQRVISDKVGAFIGFTWVDEVTKSSYNLTSNLHYLEYGYFSSIDKRTVELGFKYKKIIERQHSKLFINISPKLYSGSSKTVSPDVHFAVVHDNDIEYSLSHNSQLFWYDSNGPRPIKSINVEMKSYVQLTSKLRFLFNPFAHFLYDLKENNYGRIFLSNFQYLTFNSIKGERSIGLGIGMDYLIGNGYSITTNATFINVKSKSNNVWLYSDLSYNARTNCTIKKEILLKNSNKVLINLGCYSVFGARSFNYDPDTYKFIFKNGADGPKRNNFRLDTQVIYKMKSSLLSLSISNLLNTANLGYLEVYYLSQSIINQNQSRFLPVLSYKFDL